MQTTEVETAVPADRLETVASMLKAVAHPIRLSILQLLEKHEKLSVNEICEVIGTEQSLTSHHLSNMRLKGVLACRREGQKIFYQIRLKEVSNLLACIEHCAANL